MINLILIFLLVIINIYIYKKKIPDNIKNLNDILLEKNKLINNNLEIISNKSPKTEINCNSNKILNNIEEDVNNLDSYNVKYNEQFIKINNNHEIGLQFINNEEEEQIIFNQPIQFNKNIYGSCPGEDICNLGKCNDGTSCSLNINSNVNLKNNLKVSNEELGRYHETEDIYDKSVECSDAGWRDRSGTDCSGYVSRNLCTQTGEAGIGWNTEEWGPISDYADDQGRSATDVCCGCGGVGITEMPIEITTSNCSEFLDIDDKLSESGTGERFIYNDFTINSNLDYFNKVLPVGSIILWHNKKFDDNIWKLCDGKTWKWDESRQLLVETFVGGLYSIKTPDLRGRFVLGNETYLNTNIVGGEKEIILKEENLPDHYHEYEDSIHPSGSAKRCSGKYHNIGAPEIKTLPQPDKKATPHNNMPPYKVLQYIMKIRNINSN
jgi:microcystin-dependent protein